MPSGCALFSRRVWCLRSRSWSTASIDGRCALMDIPSYIRIRFDQSGSRPVVLASATPTMDPGVLEELIVDFFDLRADLEAFSRAIRRDVRFARLVSRHPGARLPRYLDPFEGITRAILGQQVSLSAARTMVNRLVERFGERIDRDWRAFQLQRPWGMPACAASHRLA